MFRRCDGGLGMGMMHDGLRVYKGAGGMNARVYADRIH